MNGNFEMFYLFIFVKKYNQVIVIKYILNYFEINDIFLMIEICFCLNKGYIIVIGIYQISFKKLRRLFFLNRVGRI